MAEWIISLIECGGYFGVALLMFLENLFPPIPSELVLPFAGYVAATGKLHPFITLLAAVAGALAGALPWYWAGYRLGQGGLQRFSAEHGRFLTFCPEDLVRAEGWFRRHGPAAVAFGRMVPGLRSVISMPAGVARMAMSRFLCWSALGCFAWSFALLAAGYLLRGQFESATQTVEWVTRSIVGLIVLAYVWRVVRFGRQRSGNVCD